MDGLTILVCAICSMGPAPIRAADTTYLRSSIENHFGSNRHHDVNKAYKAQARRYIYDEFRKFGLETEYQTFKDPSISDTEEFHNVIGILKGRRFGTSGDRILGLGAHYDTVRNSSGVDDNGSGVAALLEVARRMTVGYNREYTILFASFDVEELGLTGSRRFMAEWLYYWLTSNYPQLPAKTYGVIVLDTIMNYNSTSESQMMPATLQPVFQQLFPDVSNHMLADNYEGDFLLLIHRQIPDNDIASAFKDQWAGLVHPDQDRFELESFPLPFVELSSSERLTYSDFLRSDHANFWQFGVPAVFLTDSANFRGVMQSCYHEECDNLEVMVTEDNLAFLGKTCDAIYLTLHTLSEPSPKAGNHAGRVEWQKLMVFVSLLLAFHFGRRI